jgi:hypothetical protein
MTDFAETVFGLRDDAQAKLEAERGSADMGRATIFINTLIGRVQALDDLVKLLDLKRPQKCVLCGAMAANLIPVPASFGAGAFFCSESSPCQSRMVTRHFATQGPA